MTLLVLNVDRDDDLGRKGGVKSPVIGYKDNIAAANKLGLADPEDSDLNAIFLAAATYNELKKQRDDVEIVTLCGDISVGIKSDTIVAEQLKTVIKKTGATEAILISDGAEDEYILPIIQSYLRIDGVQRVSVKQSPHLEDAYYRIAKMMDDPKIRKQFLLPMALILIVWSLFAMLGMAASGFGAILFTLGLYLFIRAYDLEDNIENQLRIMKISIVQGKLSFYTGLVAVVIAVISGFYAYNAVSATTQPWMLQAVSIVKDMVWGLVIAGLVMTSGSIIDRYLHNDRRYANLLILPFSIIAFGFIASATFEALYYSMLNDYSLDPFLTPYFVGYIIVGILVALIGTTTRHYLKESISGKEIEQDIESQTLNPTE